MRTSSMSTFLSPLLRTPSPDCLLVNADTGALLARRVLIALDSAARRRGLLGRDAIDDDALVIAPCAAIHTFFMRFPIDVIFVDRQGRIVRCVSDVGPWRLAGSFGSFATVELQAGVLTRTATKTGHHLELRPAEPSS